MSDWIENRFHVVKGHELLGLVPNSGDGPQVSFSALVDNWRFKKAIADYEAKGYKFLNVGIFPGAGCEVLFEKVALDD